VTRVREDADGSAALGVVGRFVAVDDGVFAPSNHPE
jgi:hypothetical protein